jgi:hypothetical protein
MVRQIVTISTVKPLKVIINVTPCNLDVWFLLNSAWFYRFYRLTITNINMNNADRVVPIIIYLLLDEYDRR